MQFEINDEVVNRFETDGYVVVDSPLTPSVLENLRVRHEEIAPGWRDAAWPEEVHKMASQFAMMGEPAFALCEEPAFLQAARQILGVDEVFVGACAAGDTVTAESVDGRPVTSLQWHSAPGQGGTYGPHWEQVAFRVPMDEHIPANGGLHLVPGTQTLPKEQTEATLRAAVAASPDFLEWNDLFFGTHPDQVVLYPKPGQIIIWTPDVWHCTGANPEHLRRRSITWTYFTANARFRDHGTLRHVLGDETLAAWSPERRRLWGIKA